MKASKSTSSTREGDRVPFVQKFTFAGGMICGAMGYNGVQIIGKPVLNIIFGMNPAVIGTVLALMRIWDGLLDPIMGRISDNCRHPLGRRRPFIIIGAVLTGLAFPALWWLSPDWTGTAKVIYLTIACMLFYAAFTVYAVPWVTLSTELTPDYEERSRVRGAMTMMGTFVFLAYGWVFALTQQDIFSSPVVAIRILSWVLAGVMILFGVLSGILPKERYRTLAASQEKVGIFVSFKTFLGDRTYLKLVGIGTGILLGNQLIDFLSYYVGLFYVFEGDLQRGSVITALSVTIARVLEFITAWLLSKYAAGFDKRKVVEIAIYLALAGTLGKWFLLTPDYPYLILFVGFYMAPANAAFWMIYSSMQADFPDYDEHRTGLRREGMLGALNGWLIKVTVAIALVGSGFILNLTGFHQELRGDQAESTFLFMRLLLIAVPCTFYVLSLYFVRRYPIGKKEMNQIRADLESRRGDT